ncbi:MAG: hypothetical protein CMJ58_25820 [Planctomycetaceae bacterium]|nr:hypothetical protein [Planctomycetaceae bacterium]
MHVQRTLDFDAPAAHRPESRPQPEPEQVATDTSLPPPLVRPDRQIVYADARTHYDWHPAADLHDRDTITVDRVTDDIDGPAHRFIIKRGDTVEAYMGHNRFHVGEVIGISHARQEVRVAWDDTLKKGGWFKVGAIYPATIRDPKPTPPGKSLLAIIEQANAENAPPNGWADADLVPTAVASLTTLSTTNGSSARALATFTSCGWHYASISRTRRQFAAMIRR